MFYDYVNATGDIGNPARLDFRVTPYIGLAYCDDDVFDNEFNDVNLTGPAPGPFNTVPPGTYPNMFDFTGNEIGNFMPARSFTLTGTGVPYWGTAGLRIFSMDHCHVIGANTVANIYNPNLIFFDITAPPAPYVPATPQEEILLSQYGKVFFYYWEAVDPVTAVVIAHGYVMPECDTSNPTYWTNTGITANLPTGAVADLYYNHYSDDNPLGSFEVVLDAGTFPHEDTFSHTVGTQTYNYKVDIVTYLGGTSPLVSTLKLSLY